MRWRTPRAAADTKIASASAYSTSEQAHENSITRFFGYRSTSDPRKNPETATVML